MKIIGCDLHAAHQALAILDCETGEVVEHTLRHEGTSVRDFYARLGTPATVALEATGMTTWFLTLLEELGIRYLVGHPSAVRKAETRQQKHDRRDAALLMRLAAEGRFPAIWMPSTELRDVRALLLHRHQWVRMRTRVQNALQAIARDAGGRRRAALLSPSGQRWLADVPLAPCAADRRTALLALNQALTGEITRLETQITTCADARPAAQRLMTHPGVGAITALATDVFLGDPKRFASGKALASYIGLIPREYSTGGRQRLGRLTKQGNPFLRFLWCEAAVQAARRDADLRRFFGRKATQKGAAKAHVAVGRKLGIRLWIMLRDEIDYAEFCRRAQLRPQERRAYAGMPEVNDGPHRVTD
jgi:transposase